jgi:hypothetical protein
LIDGKEPYKMKKLTLFAVIICLLYPMSSDAEEFLGAPIVPKGTEVQKTNLRLELKTPLSHDEAVAFYREALKDGRDIKFREWKDSTYIEDDGKLSWHSITISKGEREGTTVVIMKDNWTWIIGTLVLRYIGVFAVLLLLFLGMAVSGSIISRSVKKMEARKTAS